MRCWNEWDWPSPDTACVTLSNLFAVVKDFRLKDTQFFSFDVVSLFANIPTDETINYVWLHLMKQNWPRPPDGQIGKTSFHRYVKRSIQIQQRSLSYEKWCGSVIISWTIIRGYFCGLTWKRPNKVICQTVDALWMRGRWYSMCFRFKCWYEL